MTTVNETWHVFPEAPFDDAEFYRNGPVVTFSVPGHTVEVSSEGKRCLDHDDEGTAIRTAEEFRARFPAGVTPADGDGGWCWTYNGWFAVAVDGDDDGEDVLYSLAEAVDVARDHVERLTGG